MSPFHPPLFTVHRCHHSQSDPLSTYLLVYPSLPTQIKPACDLILSWCKDERYSSQTSRWYMAYANSPCTLRVTEGQVYLILYNFCVSTWVMSGCHTTRWMLTGGQYSSSQMWNRTFSSAFTRRERCRRVTQGEGHSHRQKLWPCRCNGLVRWQGECILVWRRAAQVYHRLQLSAQRHIQSEP